MSWDQFKAQIKRKKFLIGIIFIDSDGKELENYQTSGIVDDLTDNGIFVFEREDGSLFKLPYDPKSISLATGEEYRERSTGRAIVKPDYITEWSIEVSDEASIEEIKMHGFSE